MLIMHGCRYLVRCRFETFHSTILSATVCVCARVCLYVLGWFAKPTRSNVAEDSVPTRKYLREFLDEMQPDKIREHLR